MRFIQVTIETVSVEEGILAGLLTTLSELLFDALDQLCLQSVGSCDP